jgi:DNA-binding transcriptional LysR family regulator
MNTGADSDDNGGRQLWSELEVGGGRWLGVGFRHLGALDAVAREGSFRRAAESLGYVQSAISGQIAHLERIVGTQLVERSSGTAGATPTAAGRVLLSHVDEILARFEAARVDVRALAEGTEVVVRVAVIDGVGVLRLPKILHAFSDRFPAASVEIDETQDDRFDFERLATGDLDLMITELPLPDGPFDYTLLERDPYVLLAAAGSPLSTQASPPNAAQLAKSSLLVPAASRSTDSLAAGLREFGLGQPPWLRPRGVAAVQALVGAGLGVAIVPALAVDRDDASTVAIDAPGLLPERLIVLVSHREREYSATVRGFAEIVDGAFNDHPPGVT